MAKKEKYITAGQLLRLLQGKVLDVNGTAIKLKTFDDRDEDKLEKCAEALEELVQEASDMEVDDEMGDDDFDDEDFDDLDDDEEGMDGDEELDADDVEGSTDY